MRSAVRLAAALLALAAPMSAMAQRIEDPALETTDTIGEDEIVVRGALIRCRPRPGDPLDLVTGLPGSGTQVMMRPDADGRVHFVADASPGERWISGPDYWQRDGTGLANYVFRTPTDGTPLCMGARTPNANGWVQQRRMLDPAPFICHYLRFTAFAAVSRGEAMLWLNAGGTEEFAQYQISGTQEWTPVRLQAGPVQPGTTVVGYGVLLRKGDVWFHQPQLEMIPDAELPPHQSRQAALCRRKLERRPRLR